MLKEQKELIEKLVKQNPKYIGNEDLLDDFINETFKRAYIIFNSVSSISNIESYIGKVATTAMITVLKNLGRVIRTTEGYVSSEEVLARTQSISDSTFTDIKDPQSEFENTIDYKDLLESAISIVKQTHEFNPVKNYLEIFYLRYIKQSKQSLIAKEMNISQGEVSKRLLELSIIVKEKLDVNL